jgi:hypothetical protein
MSAALPPPSTFVAMEPAPKKSRMDGDKAPVDEEMQHMFLDLAKNYEWPRLFDVLRDYPELVNAHVRDTQRSCKPRRLASFQSSCLTLSAHASSLVAFSVLHADLLT